MCTENETQHNCTFSWGWVIVTVFTHIQDKFLRPKNETKTRGSSYMQVQKCMELNWT